MHFMEKPMARNALRVPVELFVVAVVALALTSCGTARPIVCPASSSALCQCGPGVAACPVIPGPELLYATSNTGQILAFSIDHNSGGLTTISSLPGPAMSLSLTAVNDQFLYASDSLNAQLDGFSINQTTGALTSLASSPFSTGTISFPVGLASPPGSDLLYAADAGRVDAFT
jgi:hypothetical protein